MLVEGTMIITWLGAGAAVGSLLTYRLASGVMGQEKDQQLKSYKVENEALGRTNLIYRERIDQLENALFSNEKFLEMTGEIDFLRSSNFKLRSRLRDLECLVAAEKKKASREQVEKLENTVRNLKHRIEKESRSIPALVPATLELLPAKKEVAVTGESGPEGAEADNGKERKWSAILKARRIT
ncbi:hypothetical protein SAMN05660649_01142 [Desulfotomaculum arcticum]|uniref:Uncharacterized protein n=1 Tax=Desulfotruncus arcticus DSM 17038 TaxID=1121424 RepID=A0A1I2QHN5_9FIRM|nr:hypothetical protein [Desulfotruncus arcticus]SFG25071.1 hypothetical protein SAMN05660649_01142 [Desulfotomaculum arcticum] [Desulfotruncus arcticus DSM 17038]